MKQDNQTEETLPKNAWLIVGLLFVVACLNYLDRTTITTMRSSIMADMPMTEAQFGLLSAVFLWVYGILSPFAGYLADKFNRSRVILISLIVWSIVTWLTAYTQNYEQLVITRALMGISEACYIPAALALIVDYHKGSTRSLATGIHMAGVMAGQSLGFMGGWIAERSHWSMTFVILGVIGVVYAILLSFFIKDRPKTVVLEQNEDNKVEFWAGIKQLFSSFSFIKALCFWSLLAIVSWLVMGWLPTYYKEHFNLSQSTAGFYATAYLYPASLVGVIFGGFLADRWSKKNPRARLLVPAIGMLIAAPFIFMASSTAILPIAIGFFMIYAFTRAFSDANMMPILCLISDERYRATGYGVLNLFSCIVGGLSIYVGGYLRDAKVDLSHIYQFAGVTMLVCAVILFSIKPQQAK